MYNCLLVKSDGVATYNSRLSCTTRIFPISVGTSYVQKSGSEIPCIINSDKRQREDWRVLMCVELVFKRSMYYCSYAIFLCSCWEILEDTSGATITCERIRTWGVKRRGCNLWGHISERIRYFKMWWLSCQFNIVRISGCYTVCAGHTHMEVYANVVLLEVMVCSKLCEWLHVPCP